MAAEDRPAKQPRLAPEAEAQAEAANVIIQLESAEGQQAGATRSWSAALLLLLLLPSVLLPVAASPVQFPTPYTVNSALSQAQYVLMFHSVKLCWYVLPGPALDVPHSVTPQQLEVLLNGLLQNEEKTPYSFYVEGQVGYSLAQQQQQQRQQRQRLY
jgi:hypothetical protein